MPKEHNQLDYAVRIQRGVRVITGIASDEGGLTRVGETWQPVLDPYGQPEWITRIGDRASFGSQLQAGVAGQLAGVGLRNPAGSAYNLVVETMILCCLTAAFYEFRTRVLSATAVTSTGNGGSRDSRDLGFGGGSAGLITTASAVAAATFGNGPFLRVLAPAGVNYTSEVPVIISPGFEVFWVQLTGNTQFAVSYAWREVRRKPGE